MRITDFNFNGKRYQAQDWPNRYTLINLTAIGSVLLACGQDRNIFCGNSFYTHIIAQTTSFLALCCFARHYSVLMRNRNHNNYISDFYSLLIGGLTVHYYKSLNWFGISLLILCLEAVEVANFYHSFTSRRLFNEDVELELNQVGDLREIRRAREFLKVLPEATSEEIKTAAMKARKGLESVEEKIRHPGKEKPQYFDDLANVMVGNILLAEKTCLRFCKH